MAERSEKRDKNKGDLSQADSNKQSVDTDTILSALRESHNFSEFSDEELLTLLTQTVQNISYSKAEVAHGPIPPPSFLRDYEEILPGASDRIFKMAENNADHRHTLNEKIVNNGITQSNKGQLYSFITSLAIIGAAVFCAFYGETLPSSILGALGGIYIIPSIWKMLKSSGHGDGNDPE